MAGSQAKPSSKAEFNSFVKGLITEASPLNFPQNASVAEQNFELFRDGTRKRRFGLDFESPFAYRGNTPLTPPNQFTNRGFNTYVWESPGGRSGSELVVVQYGNIIRFYDNQKDSISFPDSLANIVIGDFPSNVRFGFGTVNGKLVVGGGVENIFVVDYLGGTGFSQFPNIYQRLLTRDIWGVQPGPENDNNPGERYSTYDQFHFYNLTNQSWGVGRRGQIKYSGSTTLSVYDDPGIVDPTVYFFNNLGAYPADNETVYTGLQFQPAISGVSNQPTETMITSLYNESRLTTGTVSKGHFIIELLRRGESRGVAHSSIERRGPFFQPFEGQPADFTPGGAIVLQGFAGRMFFGGFDGAVIEPDNRSPSLESFIAFSQIVRNTKDIPKCYQEGDPTSREAPEIIDTDGGLIRISGCAKVISMKPLGASLIVFGSNGIWEINGGGDYGFTATNYKVRKLSDVGAFTESSIVEDVGRLFFWALDGIYMIGADQFQVNNVNNISLNTIQTAYEAIPSTAKLKAAGAYDPYTKKIKWVFNYGLAFTSTSAPGELVFDTSLGAFYINRIGTGSGRCEVVDLFVTSPYRTGTDIQDVLAGVDQVFAGTDLVITDAETRASSTQGLKYLVVVNNSNNLNYTFAEYNNTTYKDFEKVDGIGADAKAFLLTGAQTAGDSSVYKQIPYLTMHFKRTENGYDINGDLANQSSCFVRSQWDFANTINSNKWGSLFQGYRYNNSFLTTNPSYDTGFELITTKSKLRGRGKAFSLYLESEPLKDLQILGWNIAVNGNGIT